MSNDQHVLPPTRVDVSNLMDQPGATRQVDLVLPPPAGLEVPLTAFTDDVRVDGVLESLVDGILLRGTVAVGVAQQCASCLEPLEPGTIDVDVAELFSDPADAESPEDVEVGYTIDDGMIDVDALVRDALAQITPTAPKCRPDCAGLCPSCGVNLNDTTCDCGDDEIDDRWAALADLDITS